MKDFSIKKIAFRYHFDIASAVNFDLGSNFVPKTSDYASLSSWNSIVYLRYSNFYEIFKAWCAWMLDLAL